MAATSPTSKTKGPVLIGLGSNLPGRRGEPPKQNILHALELLERRGVALKRLSPPYESEPVPRSGQPWFVNAAAEVAPAAAPDALLALLLEVEQEMGRKRRVRNEARIIDLDLLAYGDRVIPGNTGETGLELPHPRLHRRAFVLKPLCDIAPDWVHPVLGKTARELLARLPEGKGAIRRLT